MNAFASLLFWCAVQVTLLATVCLVVDTLVGRRRPAAGALVAASALAAIVALTATAISPWPRWEVPLDGLGWFQRDDLGDAENGLAAVKAMPPAKAAATHAVSGVALNQVLNAGHRRPSFILTMWTTIADNWALLVVATYLMGFVLMALRIGVGLAAIRGYVTNSRPLTDRQLVSLVQALRVQLGCPKEIELRQSATLNTPATIGWRRRILLLPDDWPSWTLDERQAVFAHEIEHIRRRDFASWIVAQIGVAFHFYHPLVHWLAARLRLKQELAADLAAARVIGGQSKYVSTLAAMALRQSEPSVAWPARAFLPTPKTFLRRIEMLHRFKSLRSDVSRPLVWLTVTAVILATVCAAGIRGSAAGEDSQALAFKAATANDEQKTDSEVENSQVRTQASRNILKQLALALHNYHTRQKHFPPAVVIGPDGKTPHSWRVEILPMVEQQALFNQYKMDEPWDSPANKKVLEQMPDVFRSPYDDAQSTNSGYFVFTGPDTIFNGTKGMKISDIRDGTANTILVVETKRSIPWTKPEDIPFDQNKPLPEIGGFVKGHFTAVLADGAARTFEKKKFRDQLKWLIMPNDGHAVQWR